MRTRTRRRQIKRIIQILVLVLLAAAAVTVAAFASRFFKNRKDPEKPTSDSIRYTYSVSSEKTDNATDTTDPITSGTTVKTITSESNSTQTEDSSQTTDKTTTVNTEKKIAFTFDDGPHWSYTKAIADEFKKYGGHCTYFVVGNRVQGTQAEACAYAASLGNQIGSHSYSHLYYFNKCSDDIYKDEITRAHEAIKSATGVSPVLLRPPGGSMTKDRVANSAYSIILWNVDTEDWKHKKESQDNVNIIVNNVLNNVTPGDIILMHDIYANTVEAVKILLPKLSEMGYEFVTVSELFGDDLVPAAKYFNAY